MLSQRNGFLFRSLRVLIFQLLLTQFCRGQSRLIGPLQPIVAKIGDDIILPCYLEPAQDVFAMTLEWTRSDLNSMFVYVCRDAQDLIHTKHPYYKDRTSLSIDELKHGNVSLKLSKVKLTDQGRYKCYIPKLETSSFVDLVVDDFIEVQISYFAATVGLAVTLAVCVLLIVLLLFFVWKMRQNKTKKGHRAETVDEEKKNNSKSNKTEDQLVTEDEREREKLLRDETVQMGDSNKGQEKEKKKYLQDEQKNKEKSEEEIREQRQELESKNKAAVFEVFKLQNTQEVSQAQGSTSSACQDSVTGHIIVDEVDPDGKYVELRNTSHEDQQIKGWELHVRVNNRRPITQTFDNFHVLKAKDSVNVKWKKKFCKTGDQLLITLYSDTGELKHREMLEIGNSQTKSLELDTSSAGQDSVKGHIIVDEVDPEGRYVRLKNKSNKKQKMKDWQLHIQVDDRKPIIYTFDSKFKLNPGKTVTIWTEGCCATPNNTTDLVSSESWSSGDQLLVTLYSDTGKEVSMKKADITNV